MLPLRPCSCPPLLLVTLLLVAPAVTGLSSQTASTIGNPTVQLDVFYESMCPHCHRFFNDTLRHFWADTELKSLIDLRLHPAGNLQAIPTSQISEGYLYWHPDKKQDKYIYICQHGDSECLGNLIHMCAKKVLVDPERYMPLYFCMAGQPNFVPEKSSFTCMQELSITPEPIRKCVQSPSAVEEMHEIVQADVGLNPPRTYVPWVVINGRHLEINDGKGDLRTALCSALGNTAPRSCLQSVPNALLMQHRQRASSWTLPTSEVACVRDPNQDASELPA